MAGRSALVLGATGLVGARCLVHLVAAKAHDRITCLVRRPALGEQAGGDRVREQVVDFDALSAADVPRVDDVLCALGTTMKKAGSREAFRRVDHDLPLRIIELAVGAGATRVAVVSSVGADARSTSFYLRTKGELEDALASLPLRALHVLRPSLLLGERAESRPGEVIGGVALRLTSGLLLGGLRRYRPIDADAVGRAMVAAILGPDPEPDPEPREGAAARRQVHEHDEILALAERVPVP